MGREEIGIIRMGCGGEEWINLQGDVQIVDIFWSMQLLVMDDVRGWFDLMIIMGGSGLIFEKMINV